MIISKMRGAPLNKRANPPPPEIVCCCVLNASPLARSYTAGSGALRIFGVSKLDNRLVNHIPWTDMVSGLVGGARNNSNARFALFVFPCFRAAVESSGGEPLPYCNNKATVVYAFLRMVGGSSVNDDAFVAGMCYHMYSRRT